MAGMANSEWEETQAPRFPRDQSASSFHIRKSFKVLLAKCSLLHIYFELATSHFSQDMHKPALNITLPS
jgi:hypothetical protein